MVISSKSYLRQYGFFGLVGSSLAIYARFFLPLVTVVAIIELPPFLLSDVLLTLFPNNSGVIALSVLLQVGAIWFGLLPVIAAISDICLGNEVSVARALHRVTARSVFQLFGTSFLSFFIPFLCCMALIIAGLFMIEASNSWVSMSGVGIAVIGFFLFPYLLVRYAFAEQIVILENKFWFQALRRSAQVVRKSWWRIAFFWFLYVLILYSPVLLLRAGPAFIASCSQLEHPLVHLTLNFYETLATVISTPLFATFGTLFYYSERIRKHDLTIQQLVEIKTFEAA